MYLVIDIGGTEFKYALMDEGATIHKKGSIPAPKDSYETCLETLTKLYNEHSHVKGIAMSVAGIVDPNTGYCYTGGSLEYYEGKNMIDDLHKTIDVPITVENDAKAAALAEIWMGNMQGVDNGLIITLGSSVGGGVVINGKLHRGSHMCAGEIWTTLENCMDLTIDQNCWGFATRIEHLISDASQVLNIDKSDLNGRVIFDMANNGNQDVIDCISRYTKRIAGHIFSLQGTIDPRVVLIGGGISRQPLLLELLNKQIDTIYESIGMYYPRPTIKTCKFYNDSNLIGALYHYKDIQKSD